MAPSFESRLVLDGIICLFEDFDFLDNGMSWALPQTIMVKIKNERDFKGVKLLHGKKIAEVRFGLFNNMARSIILTSTVLNQQIPFSDVRKIIVNGVDKAVSLLGPNSPTNLDWNSRCCVEYEKWVYNKTCGSCKAGFAGMRLTIFPQDVHTFGNHFCEYLKNEFANMNLEMFVVLYEFMQNLEWSRAVSTFDNLSVANMSEVAVHVARDYSQKGKVLLWNREAVRKLMGPGAMTDFFCCFTGKHGNFVYDLSDRDTLAIMNIKFYSDIFKQVHRGNAPFRKPFVIASLSDVNQRGRGNDKFDRIEKFVDTIFRCKERVMQRNYNCARVEAIISLNNDDHRGIAPLLRDCVADFEQELGRADRLLSVFDFKEFENQINLCLTPALTTLKEIAIGEKRFRDANSMHCASIEILHQALACEMLISYFIYGKLDYWSGFGPRFNRDMRNYLKLNGGTFRSADTFRGLDFTNAIVVTQGELRYTGKLLVAEFVSVGVTDEENTDRLSNCMEILGSNQNSPSRINEAHQVIAEILWEEILLFAQKTIYKKPYSAVSDSDICNFIRYEPLYAISSNEFVHLMFRNASLEQQVVRRIIQAVRCVVGTHEILQKELESKVEGEIWKSGKSLLYMADDSWNIKYWSNNFNQARKALVVLPSCGVDNQKFSTATDVIKKQIAAQYQQCFERKYKKDMTVPQIITELESIEQIGPQVKMMQVVFRKLLARFITGQIQTSATTRISTLSTAASTSSASRSATIAGPHTQD